MKILERQVYVGPNLYARFPVVRLTVDLGELEQWPTGKLDGFSERLLRALPTLDAHTCSHGERGGFVRRLKEDGGTWLGHVLEHVAIELQVLAGSKVAFGKTRGTGQPGRYNVVYEYQEEPIALDAGDLAHKLLESLLPERLRTPGVFEDDFDFEREVKSLIKFAQERQLGPSTASLVQAAKDRDIPYIRLNDRSLIQFGHGKYQQRIQATITSRTSHIAVELASDKEETNRLLATLGLPVPRQKLVRGPEDAARAAEKLGYPVVVKPLNANHGKGVTTELREPEAVKAAFTKAREFSRTVIVEQFIEGVDHRMLLVDGELIAVAKRVPGHVVGDGRHTVAELVDKVNQDPRRGIGHEKVMTRLELDEEAERMLKKRGLTTSSVPAAGDVVYLRGTANLSTGGTSIDLTDQVHPDNREMARRTARAIGLDVIGIDFLTPDVTRSYREVGGGICEVNAAPGFRMHVAPSEGKPRDVGKAVIDMLFKPDAPARIPIAAVTGTNGKTTTARMVAHIQKMNGATVGLTTTDGVYIDGERVFTGDMTGPMAAHMVLRDATVDCAVLETARGGLLRAGLGFQNCDVGAVLNVTNDHLGLKGIDTLEQLAQLKRIVVEVARDCAVLNADDPLCLKMADHSEAKRIAYVTMNPRNELVRKHIRAGGLAIVSEDGINGQMITLYDGGVHLPLLWTHLIPATMEGKALHNVQNAMFAAVIAHAMGVRAENIRQGLRTFDTTYYQAPGRLNVYDELPFKVILDYGHNPAAIQAMVDFVGKLEVAGKRIAVMAAAGDRRDTDIREMCRIASKAFDRFVLREDDDRRGRAPGELTRLMEAELLAVGVSPDRIIIANDEPTAVDRALHLAQRGDLLLVWGDKIARCWKQITKFNQDAERSHPAAPSSARANPATEEDGQDGALFLDGKQLIRDQRGVRIPRELEAED